MWWHLRRERPMQGSERIAYAFADRVICVARAVKRTLGDPPKAVVIHDGIPANRLDYGASGEAFKARLGWPAEALVVGNVSSLAPRKRHDLFIRMAMTLAEEFPRARFFIAGHRPEGAPASHEAKLHDLAGPLEADGRLVFLGWVEEMSEAFAAMDVFAFPTDNEGLGLVAIEAMQMGVPVVRTDTAGAEDMIRDGETGFIIPTDDLDALTARVRLLLADEALRRRMGQAGMAFARPEFSARHMTDRIEALMLGAD
jgi:glycosyltransferase involved in cell wall biosynthesis